MGGERPVGAHGQLQFVSLDNLRWPGKYTPTTTYSNAVDLMTHTPHPHTGSRPQMEQCIGLRLKRGQHIYLWYWSNCKRRCKSNGPLHALRALLGRRRRHRKHRSSLPTAPMEALIRERSSNGEGAGIETHYPWYCLNNVFCAVVFAVAAVIALHLERRESVCLGLTGLFKLLLYSWPLS